jgi:hypothetical protein
MGLANIQAKTGNILWRYSISNGVSPEKYRIYSRFQLEIGSGIFENA